MREKSQEPSMENLPKGVIDWAEISDYIEEMLAAENHCTKGWKTIWQPAETAHLQKNSLVVLHMLYEDLYEYFFRQREERFEVWRRMERFVRTKYSGLSDKALSRIITVYHIDDR